MTQVVARVRSESREGVTYEIRQSAGGQLYCMCPAWRFGKVIRRDDEEYKAPCKHLKSLGVTELHRLEVPSRFFVQRRVA